MCCIIAVITKITLKIILEGFCKISNFDNLKYLCHRQSDLNQTSTRGLRICCFITIITEITLKFHPEKGHFKGGSKISNFDNLKYLCNRSSDLNQTSTRGLRMCCLITVTTKLTLKFHQKSSFWMGFQSIKLCNHDTLSFSKLRCLMNA